MKNFLIIALLFVGTACGGSSVDEGENYGNLLTTDQGLILTESEHQIGWGKTECTMCHNLENIHIIDRTGITDIKTVHQRALDQGIAVCATCHGTNGVP